MSLTLDTIGVNLIFSAFSMIVCFVMFGIAVRSEAINDIIAPRTWGRSTQVIKNVLEHEYWSGWFRWATQLSYQDMLRGIPGTGTRNDGKSGTLLRCNLDGIVLVRMQVICFKVACLATFGCMAVILPLNLTAPCNPREVGFSACDSLKNLTDFQQTTLANIPTLENISDSSWRVSGVVGRLYAIIFFSYSLYIYTAVLLWREWIDLLALRRVFYFEFDHWAQCREERHILKNLEEERDIHNTQRPSYITDPEVRDTVPNISLWSVLYRLPDGIVQQDNVESKDWQLFLTTQFFDQCIPNQPGFSSSVAAVTILPSATELGVAWRKWYIASRKLRRLRYIQQRLAKERRKRGEEASETLVFERGGVQQSSDAEMFESQCQSPVADMSAIIEAEEEDDDNSNDNGDGTTDDKNTEGSNSEYSRDLQTVEEHEEEGEKTVEIIPPASTTTGAPQEESNDKESIVRNKQQPEVVPGSSGNINYHSAKEVVPDRPCIEEQPMDVTITRTTTITTEQTLEVSVTQPLLSEDRVSRNESSADTIPESADDAHQTLRPILRRRKRESRSSLGSSGSHTKTRTDWQTQSLSLQDVFPQEYAKQGADEEEDDDDDFYFVYNDDDEERKKYAQILGFPEQQQYDTFLHTYGPEQMGVHAVEFSRSAGACCTRGCCEGRIGRADIDELIEMEEEAIELLEQANQDLIQARSRVHEATLDVALDKLYEEPSHESRAQLLLHGKSQAVLKYDLESSQQGSNPKVEGIRKRVASVEEQWAKAQDIAQTTQTPAKKDKRHHYRFLDTGSLRVPFSSSWRSRWKSINAQMLETTAFKSNEIVDYAIGTNTYAVVTFTSRQAALAARQCIVDGSASDQWKLVEEIPVSPLADAAPWNFWHGRNCCRPVTLTTNDNQKFSRKIIANTLLFFVYFLYTIPLSAASALMSPESLGDSFPFLQRFREGAVGTVSGFLTGVLYTIFFSVCPYLFKTIANFGSGASSVRAAEQIALKYYWYFMLLTSFTGTSLASMVLEAINSDFNFGQEAQGVLRNVGAIIPTQVSATWLNWMIVRFGQTFPLFYLFQINTLLFTACRIKWLARCVRAGGAGSPVPYRLFVDTGIVFLCMISLAAVSPLVAPIALAYMTISAPMIRWLVIFVYRPDHDGGGQRWPLIFQMFISAMIVGQIFLTTMMMLKRATVPAALSAMTILPTYWFSLAAENKFLRTYKDAGLLQTSQLDGWGASQLNSSDKREDYRRWLVDCHRASYVPICLAGSGNLLTAEPAAVIPSPDDVGQKHDDNHSVATSLDSLRSSTSTCQRGAIFTRVKSMSESGLRSFTSHKV